MAVHNAMEERYIRNIPNEAKIKAQIIATKKKEGEKIPFGMGLQLQFNRAIHYHPFGKGILSKPVSEIVKIAEEKGNPELRASQFELLHNLLGRNSPAKAEKAGEVAKQLRQIAHEQNPSIGKHESKRIR